MKKYFDFSRFGKYLTYDLANARSRYGLSALITGIIPAVVFVFFQLFSLVFTSSSAPLPEAIKIVTLVCVAVVMTIAAPVKLYGFLTEKRAGSDWLMIPASALEKFLSMLIILCIVLPLAVLLTFGLTDLLLSAVFPVLYGDSLVLNVTDVVRNTVDMFRDNEYVQLTTAGYASFAFSLWEPILIFALGAMLFKSGKVAKTIFGCFLIATVTSSVVFLCLSGFDMNVYIENIDIANEKAQFIINTIVNVSYLLFFGVVLGTMYYRIRTLKH